MKAILCVLALSCAVVVASSCARAEKEDYAKVEQASLDAWIAENAPDAIAIEGTGMYYEVIDHRAELADVKATPGQWVTFEYTLRDLAGNIAYTRNEQVARHLGTHSPYAHYTPEDTYVATKQASSSIPKGLYSSLLGTPGGEVRRIYMPSSQFRGSAGLTDSYGYGGQVGIEGSTPLILDSLVVLRSDKDPQAREQREVVAYATALKPAGMGFQARDSIRKYLYMDILQRKFVGDTIPDGDMAHVFYKAYFLDGAIFDTNIDSVWINNFGAVRTNDVTTSISLTRNKDLAISSSMPSKPFSAVLKYLCYGDSVRMVVASRYAYDYAGRLSNRGASSQSYTYSTAAYSDYTADYLDAMFGGAYGAQYNYSTSSNVVAEIKPYTPIIYEFVVARYSDGTNLEGESDE